MKLQFFSVNALQPELDQEKINSFCSRHRLLNIEKALVTKANHTYWAVCITYRHEKNKRHRQGKVRLIRQCLS